MSRGHLPEDVLTCESDGSQLERIAGLYAVEKDVRGRSPEERRKVRSLKSRPLIAALEPWLRAKLGLISQKSKLAAAIRSVRIRPRPQVGAICH